jgi:proline iminopeptidase
MTTKILFPIIALLTISSARSQPAFQHPPGKYVNVNGAKLWVETEGTGDPLFLIAGGPGNSHVYMHSFDALRDSFTLVFIDNFGRGKSDTAKNVSEYSTQRDVEDVEGIRVALGYDKINLLGHSYGSEVVQLFAIKYGAHLKHLIIADGFFNGAMWQENDDNCNREFAEQEPELWDSLMMLRNKGLRSSDPEHYKMYGKSPGGLLYFYNPDNEKKLPDDKAYPNGFNTKLYYQLVGPDGDFVVGNDIANFDVTKQLKDLKMPILIIAGRYDRISAPKFSVQYKKYCPQAKFLMFEHSGHSPMVEEPAKEFTAIKQFLSK